MKIKYAFWAAIAIVVFFLFQNRNLMSQSSRTYEKMWIEFDSLMNHGFEKDAAKLANQMMTKSKNEQNKAMYFKALLAVTKLELRKMETDEMIFEQINTLEKHASTKADEALLLLVKAEYYQKYYNNNRWIILERSKVYSSNNKADVTEWTSKQFIDTVMQLWQTSLSYKSELIATDFAEYEPVFRDATPNIKGRKQFDNLYEFFLVAFLNFVDENESYFAPDFRKWSTSDTKWLTEDPATFVAYQFASEEGDIKQSKVQAYQMLTQYYHQIGTNEKLAAYTLKRILYLLKEFQFPNANQTITNSLNAFIQKYETYPAAAEAKAFLVNKSLENKELSTVAAANAYEQIIKQYPNTSQSEAIYSQVSKLYSQYFSITTEVSVIPNQPFKALLTYKNIASTTLKVVPFMEQRAKETLDEYKVRISSLPAIATYTVDLPASEDLNQHSVEFKIDGLKPGTYLVFSEEYKSDNYNWAAEVQVSNISIISVENKVYVLDRTTGKPLKGAHVKLSTNNNTKNATLISAEDGSVTIPPKSNFYGVVVDYSGDHYEEDKYGYWQEKSQAKASNNVFLFTDRDIYRPGQKIYFKAILIHKKSNQEVQVLNGEKLKVSLYKNRFDNNAIASLSLTTNEFGSVDGSFIAPEEGTVGDFVLIVEKDKKDTNDNFSTVNTIKIEEYKRPKFYIAFDSLKGDYYVHTALTIKGNAKAYAGNNINDAQVSYIVTRNVFLPFRWRCYWWHPETTIQSETIAIGNTTTDTEGNFEIPFTAIPDNTNPDFWPIFTYSVQVKVTDINGETHEKNHTVNAAYRDAIPSASISDNVVANDLRAVEFSVSNVNNIAIQNSYEILVAKLIAPQKLLAKRLWKTPDQWLYDETTYRRYFPNDEYKDELKPESWTVGQTTYTANFKGKQIIDLIKEQAITTNGWYLLQIKTKDSKGQEVIQKYYTNAVIESHKAVANELIIYSNKNSVQPGDLLEVKPLSIGDANHYITFFKAANNKQFENIYNFKVEEQHRGGFYYYTTFVKHNRIYKASKYINVPFDNKDLKIEWNTKRSTLLPGSKEQWTYTIKDPKGLLKAGEMLASMYDKSLDDIYASNWNFNNLMSGVYAYINVSSALEEIENTGLWSNNDTDIRRLSNIAKDTSTQLIHYRIPSLKDSYYRANFTGSATRISARSISKKETPEILEADASAVTFSEPQALGDGEGDDDKAKVKEELLTIAPRSNFNETAYFYPNLRTNETGELSFEFTMPEALTTWKWRSFAHTKDWKLGYLEGEVITQKDLMVQPNIPRVFRQNDAVTLSTKIANLTTQALNAEVWLEIVDAQTQQNLVLPFRLKDHLQQVAIPAGQSTEVTWELHIPESIFEPVVVRIFAKSGKHTDGEEHYIPVVTNRMLVTETLPLPMYGNGTKNFVFDKLKNNNSNSLLTRGLTVEYTANPTWYVIQALPYLADYPYDCAEQLFSKFYANAIAQSVVDKMPQVEKIFEQWKIKDTAALLSNLEKNEQLKSALMEETPWVLEANNEAAQKQRIAALFETKKLSRDLNKTLNQLSKKQMSNGAFSWFEGMQPSRYITQTIALGLIKMQAKENEAAKSAKAKSISQNAMEFLEQEMIEDYESLIRNKAKLSSNNLSASTIQYLYAFSLNKSKVPTQYQKEYDYYLGQVSTYWKDNSLMLQAYMAEILWHQNQQTLAKSIMESIRQRAINNPELGMYWKANEGYYSWSEAPIETQAALILAFKKIDNKEQEIAAMQTWLIKNKQTNRWHNTTATVDATYALFADNAVLLTQSPKVNIQFGNQTLNSEELKTEVGTGYFIQAIPGKEVTADMGNVQVNVSDMSVAAPSWGAVYWQYFEQFDKITSANTSLKIKKEIFIVNNTNKGETLTAITDNTPIEIGDKVVVRMVVTTDRNLEYVHIKDTRAACFEPKDALSAYVYKAGLGYYQTNKDISTNFFINNLRKGTHVLEYTVYANAKGNYSSGIASVQCMYAPEFAAHSEGTRLLVK